MILYEFVREHLWLILFVVWGIPLMKYRSKFRKMVYQTDDWRINFQLRFVKEIKALFENVFPDDEEFLQMRNFYRFYLLIYVVLFLAWKLK